MDMKRMLRTQCSFAAFAAIATGFSGVAYGQEAEEEARQEKITVTGSFIAGTPEDAALPVDVVDRGELDAVGAPTVNEILRNLPATQGLIGETNQFDTRGGQGNEGTTTINLRGLGSSRTLVLLNGQRHVSTNTVGVDVNFMPGAAIGRIEVLKDGAAALYGSDAIGGVVNFITRSGFEGVELRASHQFIDGSDGDTEIGGIAGWAGDNMDFMVAGEYGKRSKLPVKERDWALASYAQNPQSGFSSIGNPGTFINPFLLPTAAAGGIVPVAFGQADPNCDALGGVTTPTIPSLGADICRFQYTYFDNLIEETETTKIFTEFNWDISDTLSFHAEAAYSKMSMEEWNTSPAYPPQALLETRVDADHPGLVDFFAQNPAWAASLQYPAPAPDYIFWGRYTGVAGLNGQPEEGVRETEQMRLSAGFDGSFGAVDWQANVSYSSRERYSETNDMYVERFAFALDGLGGANCDPATGTPGVGDCMYYNPFSNAIERSAVNGAVNPQYNPAVANDPELLSWLTDKLITTSENELLAAELVFSGETGLSLGGGNVGWAAGYQLRSESFSFEINDIANLDLNPCPFNDPASITNGNATAVGDDSCAAPVGQFAFLAGSTNRSLDRDIHGGFVEVALPIADNFDMQVALRYEDYGGNVGSSVDPKIAAKWQITDQLALRGSASTTFRGPSQTFLSGRTTSLQFIGPTNAFKAVDTVGNTNLDPEKALATNVGLLYENDMFRGSVDWWRFDFSDPLQLESASQIVSAYDANACATTGAGSEICDDIASHLSFQTGSNVSSAITRIERSWINGADIVTSGIDFFGQLTFDVGNTGELKVGLDGTYTMEYESDDFLDINGVKLANGGDFVGYLNEGTPFQTIVDLRSNLFARYSQDNHNFSYTLRYVNGYEDVAPSVPTLGKIDSQITHDVTYSYALFGGDTRLSLSVYNLTDEDPPLASTDLSYDAYTHSAFGRMIKVGVVAAF